ncbi:MAG: quinone-dependent dihydroorotate dehydrogenase [Akkermansiaceae bacterium]|nr:quinone-dependent dihydroorotate dehydrogenase [Akkermansiaceae bacterium]MCF7732508.1 quinone-dependent dihydroorotate dehydrogenase [Akkermansiaceae bacterium]
MTTRSTLGIDKTRSLPHDPRVIESLYPFLRAALFRLDPETAHHVSMSALRMAERCGLLKLAFPADELLAPVEVMGLRFPNRVGLAAGLDKEADTIDALARLGFGCIEIGTITPRPQPGNPKPRVFRLIDHEAIINRMGFNNQGVDVGVANVRRSKTFRGIIGFNIGKNKDTPNESAAEDYLTCLRQAYPVADYIAVNLSSPNTPGLRDLQGPEASARLLETLKQEQQRLATEHGKQVPLLFKVAPDLDETHIRELSTVFLNGGLDGLIATNTTLDRELVAGHPRANEPGGLSGRPQFRKSTEVLRAFASHLGGNIPIIGVGGISSLEDAREKLKAGATLVQIYTAFIYQGPALVRRLARQL